MPRKRNEGEGQGQPEQPDPDFTKVSAEQAVEQAAAFVELHAGRAVADAMRQVGIEALGGIGKRPRRRGRPSNKWREVFLENLSYGGNVTFACRKADVTRYTAYKHRAEDPKFEQAWDDAIEDSVSLLEAEARRRALNGSDRLLEFQLKALRPEKYRERTDVRVERMVRSEIDAISAAYGISPEQVLEIEREVSEAIGAIPAQVMSSTPIEDEDDAAGAGQ